MENSGYFWHVHHDALLEYSENIKERIEYIKENKPREEVEIRLRLLKNVKGIIPQACKDARKAYEDAGKAYDDAGKAYDDARKAYDDAGKDFRDAGKAYDNARKDCASEIEALHKQECPNCPWDGQTIFKKKG